MRVKIERFPSGTLALVHRETGNVIARAQGVGCRRRLIRLATLNGWSLV